MISKANILKVLYPGGNSCFRAHRDMQSPVIAVDVLYADFARYDAVGRMSKRDREAIADILDSMAASGEIRIQNGYIYQTGDGCRRYPDYMER